MVWEVYTGVWGQGAAPIGPPLLKMNQSPTGCMLTCWFSSSLHYNTHTHSRWGQTPLSLQWIHTDPDHDPAAESADFGRAAGALTSSGMCTLAWKTYQFTQLSPSPEKAILLGVPEARSTHTVRISQLFDYSGKSLWKIDSVNARLVAGPRIHYHNISLQVESDACCGRW